MSSVTQVSFTLPRYAGMLLARDFGGHFFLAPRRAQSSDLIATGHKIIITVRCMSSFRRVIRRYRQGFRL